MNPVFVTACTRPTEAQARQTPNIDWGGGHEAPLLAEELLAVDSCGER